MDGQYKAVMLATAPSRAAAPPPPLPSAAKRSGAPPQVTAYKGVLLCERPNAPAAGSGPEPWLPSGRIDGGIGLGPAKDGKQPRTAAGSGAAAARAPALTHLTRHRKYLKELAAQRGGGGGGGGGSPSPSSAQGRAKFTEAQAALRKLALGHEAPPPPAKPASAPAGGSKAGGRMRAAGGEKPAWAMTEGEAEEKADESAEELLDFAKGLDFEAFKDDLELRACLAAMRRRVAELAAAADAPPSPTADPSAPHAPPDPDRPRRVPHRPPPPPPPPDVADGGALPGGGPVEHAAEWDGSTAVGPSRLARGLDAEALELADKVLAVNPKLRALHTRVSLAKLLRDSARREGPVGAATASRAGE